MRSSELVGGWVVGLLVCVAGCSRAHGPDDFGVAGEDRAGDWRSDPPSGPTDPRPGAAGSGRAGSSASPRGRTPTTSQAGSPATPPRAGSPSPARAGAPAPRAGAPSAPRAGAPSTSRAGAPSTPRAGAAAQGGAGAPALPGAGAAAAPAGSGVECGAARCVTPQVPGFMLPPACCADAATGTCGTVSGGVCRRPPPPAPNCPSPSLAGITVRACCITATNLCGVDGSSLGMGCVSLSALPGVDTGIPPTRCDGTLVE